MKRTLRAFMTLGALAEADSGPQKPTPMAFPILRRTTTEPGQKLTSLQRVDIGVVQEWLADFGLASG